MVLLLGNMFSCDLALKQSMVEEVCGRLSTSFMVESYVVKSRLGLFWQDALHEKCPGVCPAVRLRSRPLLEKEVIRVAVHRSSPRD